jgi:hypothetical protein
VLYGAALLAAPSAGADRTVAGLALPDVSTGAPGRVVAGAMAVVAAVFCARNVRTAARLAAGPRRPTAAAVVVGGVAAVAVALVCGGRLTATDVLAVPNAMACAVFLTAATAVVVVTDGWRRLLGVAAVAGYLPLVPFLGVAVCVPLAVLAVVGLGRSAT